MALVLPPECGDCYVIDEKGRRIYVLRTLDDRWMCGWRTTDCYNWGTHRLKSRSLPVCDTYEEALGAAHGGKIIQHVLHDTTCAQKGEAAAER